MLSLTTLMIPSKFPGGGGIRSSSKFCQQTAISPERWVSGCAFVGSILLLKELTWDVLSQLMMRPSE